LIELSNVSSPRIAQKLAWIVAFVTFIAGVPLLKHFGPTWDLCIGELAHGELYVDYVLTGDQQFLDFSDRGARREPRQPHPDFDFGLYQWYETHPFMGIVSAVSCRLLWTQFGLVDAMTAHLLPSWLVACILFGTLGAFIVQRAGIVAAFATLVALLLTPRFLCEALSNPKDGAIGCLYVLALFVTLRAFERNSVRWFLFASALLACSLATKANAVFVPIQALVYVAIVALGRRLRKQPMMPLPWRGIVPGIIVFALTYFACSPMLWTETAARFSTHIAYFLNEGGAYNLDDFSALYATLITTPVALFILATIGAFAGRVNWESRSFLILGVVFPFVRTEVVGGVNFDGVRHFLELFPFLAALAGLGFARLLELLLSLSPASPRASRHTVTAATSLAFVAPLLAATSETWPYGTVYFNSIVGGFGHFQRSGHREATDYWAASYWEGFDWIERHAKPGSVVLVPIAPHVARSMAPCRLGPNAALSTGIPPRDGADVYVMFTTRRLLSPELPDWVEATARPVHEIIRQDGVLASIYRFERAAEQTTALALFSQQVLAETSSRRALEWLAQHPDLVAALKTKIAADPTNAEAITLAAFPEELLPDVKALLKRIPLNQLVPAAAGATDAGVEK
jgi:Dolichyl-phosphate-mannose-protein mannosyltransferase